MLRDFLCVGIGGAVGSMLRYAISAGLGKIIATPFPLATFAINVSGCFVLGLLCGFAEKHAWLQGNLMLLLATGFCGGFTTFSTFALESVNLFDKQQFFIALLYMVLSVFLGVVLCRAGFLVTR